MTTTTTRDTRPAAAASDATWLRLIWVGIATASVGLLVLALTQTFWTTSSGGDFEYAADYWMTAPALPIGIGMILHALGVHRLEHGRDGRLGTIGVWLFVVSSTIIVVACMASLEAGAELRWGPTYPVCALGSFIGIALLAAGSWRLGLLPPWMLGVWPPLMLLGSWGGQNLIPLAFACFLVVTRIVIGRRIDTRG
jgi:hypothetical protein